MGSKNIFRDIVTSSWLVMLRQFLFLAIGLTLLIPIVLRIFLFGTGNILPAPAPWGIMFKNYFLHLPLPFLIPMWLFLAPVIFSTNRIEITVRNNILYLPAESRYKARHIPLAEIILCREKTYDHTMLAQFILGHNKNGNIEQIVPLPGYSGPGVQIGFLRVRKNLSNLMNITVADKPLETKQIRVHFPCTKGKQLVELINTFNKK